MGAFKRWWLRMRLLRIENDIRNAARHRADVVADMAEQAQYEAALERHIISKTSERNELRLKLRALDRQPAAAARQT